MYSLTRWPVRASRKNDNAVGTLETARGPTISRSAEQCSKKGAFLVAPTGIESERDDPDENR
jgi:hypothetical protein